MLHLLWTLFFFFFGIRVRNGGFLILGLFVRHWKKPSWILCKLIVITIGILRWGFYFPSFLRISQCLRMHRNLFLFSWAPDWRFRFFLTLFLFLLFITLFFTVIRIGSNPNLLNLSHWQRKGDWLLILFKVGQFFKGIRVKLRQHIIFVFYFGWELWLAFHLFLIIINP